MRKSRINSRFIFLLLLLGGLAFREVSLELRPSFLRPGLHLFAYVGNTADGTLTAVDLVKLSAVSTIAVGAGPSGLRAHPTRNEIWGLSSVGGYAWILDTNTNRVVAKIPVGSEPYALDFSRDGRRAYVAASGSNAIVAIDCATRQIVARGSAGRRPWIARVAPSGKIVVVSNRDDSSISILDATSLASLAVVPVAKQPEQLAILPDSSKVFVTSGAADLISAVDLKQKVLLANLSLGGAAGDLIMKPDGGELYIPSADAHGLLIVNTLTNEVDDFLLLGMSPASGTFSIPDQRLYISDSASGHVIPIAIDIRQAGRPIPVGQNPRTCLLTPGGDILLVVDVASNDLAVIRARTSALITLIPVGGKPRDVAIKVF